MEGPNRWRHPIWIALLGVVAVSYWLFRLADPCLAIEISNRFTAKDPAEAEISIIGQDHFDQKTLDEITRTFAVTNPYGIQMCSDSRDASSGDFMMGTLAIIMLLIGVASGWLLRRRPVVVAGVVAFATLLLAFALELVVRLDELRVFPGYSNEGAVLQMIWISLGIVVAGSLLAVGGAWTASRLPRRG